MEQNLKISRLGRELSKLVNERHSGISVTVKDESMSMLQAQIIGPPNTPYENGTFTVLSHSFCVALTCFHFSIVRADSVRQLPLQSPKCTVPHQSVPPKH